MDDGFPAIWGGGASFFQIFIVIFTCWYLFFQSWYNKSSFLCGEKKKEFLRSYQLTFCSWWWRVLFWVICLYRCQVVLRFPTCLSRWGWWWRITVEWVLMICLIAVMRKKLTFTTGHGEVREVDELKIVTVILILEFVKIFWILLKFVCHIDVSNA